MARREAQPGKVDRAGSKRFVTRGVIKTMGKVGVKFFSNIQQATGMDSIEVDLQIQGIQLKAFLDEINRLVPVRLSSYNACGKDGIAVRIIVNGTMIHTIDSSDNIINQGDQVTILPLLVGG